MMFLHEKPLGPFPISHLLSKWHYVPSQLRWAVLTGWQYGDQWILTWRLLMPGHQQWLRLRIRNIWLLYHSPWKLGPICPLTHWGKLMTTWQTTFSHSFFFNENCCILMQNSLRYVPQGLTNQVSIGSDNGLAPHYASLGLNELIHWGHNPSSTSNKMSYRKISWSLKTARFVFRIVRSLWNLTSTSAALLPMCLTNFKAMGQFKLRGTGSYLVQVKLLRELMMIYCQLDPCEQTLVKSE